MLLHGVQRALLAGSRIGLSLDFANGIYRRNGITFPDFATFLSATGSTFANSTGGFARDGSASFSADTPRISNGLLTYEAARTQLILRSNALNNGASWSDLTNGGGGSIVSSADVAPDGTATAFKITLTGSDLIRQNVAATAATPYGLAIFAKKPSGGGGAAAVRLGSNNTAAWNTGVNGKLNLSAAWQRLEVDGNLISTGTQAYFIIGAVDVAGNSDAQCVGDVVLWGPELEQAANAGSFIANTTAGNKARSADALTIAVPTGLSTLTVTFDDDSTQQISSASGSYLLTTTLNRSQIKKLAWAA